nr:hypothetical protein 5 [bacterium]
MSSGIKAAVRQAVYDALNGNTTLTVYSMPPKSAGDFILIDAIRVSEASPQSFYMYDVIVGLRVVMRYQGTGSKKTAGTYADEIDAIFRPTATSTISVSGFEVCGFNLEDSEEFVNITDDAKTFEIEMNYYLKLTK